VTALARERGELHLVRSRRDAGGVRARHLLAPRLEVLAEADTRAREREEEAHDVLFAVVRRRLLEAQLQRQRRALELREIARHRELENLAAAGYDTGSVSARSASPNPPGPSKKQRGRRRRTSQGRRICVVLWIARLSG
jgi:hypothetical protein